MFITTLRINTLKLIGITALSVLVVAALVIFVPTYESTSASNGISYEKVYSNSDRVEFLSGFGWEVAQTPIEEVEVSIPAEFDTVYIGYNEIQKAQGLNLAKYKGKEVVRYTYEIKNYEGYEGTVYVNLLVYRNKIVGGDVCSADASGFIHGFTKNA
ncbi:MAG: DUF4830 domain-containing protein [Clostridia bacterium]|nr:DUF4830 domain-containing protein [Clostridia bacterium]MBQ8862225.1 DUF4830 domain-containing protein [Clostridia bacterium]